MCLFHVRLPANDLKKIEICQSIGGLHVKVYIQILVHMLVSSIKYSLTEAVFLISINSPK